ncbi:hypothetical protein C5167_008156 [Papaver somniferum]|uniref:Uncharacterized protein n=1 Tax=Papaver somniferum TaxID=3469 RepID=A0A4Y7JWM3_PAPSO|nr:protein EXORDIUM-like [Papaver somniferum]RZC64462.1 hypothetical protein C5167_008156 [Papaver somniferum]
MASSSTSTSFVLCFLLFVCLFHFSSATGRKLNELVQDPPAVPLLYHNGPLLSSQTSVNLIWYGNFKPAQRAIISDFFNSLYTTPKSTQSPSVSMWWKKIEKYYNLPNSSRKTTSLVLKSGRQILDEKYSLGKSLSNKKIVRLASRGEQGNAINVVLTSADVTVDGFCSSRCGTHGSSYSSSKKSKFAYIWVGNSEIQCPGQCAWPFHQPIYGPQGSPLVAPNNDVGIDGMVINLASLLAGTATNPFGNGYYQGPAGGSLEVASACTGIYGKGAYPGYPGNLLVDPSTRASYNANGAKGRKYLLPALFDHFTSTCSTLV